MSISIASIALLLLATATAQEAPAQPEPETAPEAVSSAMPVPPVQGEQPVEDMIVAEDWVEVVLSTSMGDIKLALDRKNAPLTTANFLAYIDEGFLEFATFYRAMSMPVDTGIAQFGVRRADKLLDPVAHEPTSETGLKHERGTISLIATAPGNGRADFFIAMGDIPGFDAGDNGPGFAVFGKVVEGMDVVEAIFNAPTDPDKGEGVMKGQMLADPVEIKGAERAGPSHE